MRLSLYDSTFDQWLARAAERTFQAPSRHGADQWVLVSRSTSGPCPWRMTYGRTEAGEPIPHGHVEARSYRMACIEAAAFGGDLLKARFI